MIAAVKRIAGQREFKLAFVVALAFLVLTLVP